MKPSNQLSQAARSRAGPVNRHAWWGVFAMLGLVAILGLLYWNGRIDESLLLSSVLTVTGWLVLVRLGALEFRRSTESAFTAQRSMLRDQLRISIFREVLPLIHKAQDDVQALSFSLTNFPGQVWRSVQAGRLEPKASRGRSWTTS